MRTKTMPMPQLLEELKRCDILQNLDERELRRFAAICDSREYAPGERLVTQDEVGSELHILVDGRVEIAVKGKEKGEIVVSEVRSGDVLGEAAIFTDLPRTASAAAVQACLVAAVPRERLFAYCKADPRAGLTIFGFVIFSLLRRLGSTSRELAMQREANVTPADLESLGSFFPKSLVEMLRPPS
jgi:CRP-like cAMP-binding protein